MPIGLLFLIFVCHGVHFIIHAPVTEEGQHAKPFGGGFHSQKHSADVRMLNDSYLRRVFNLHSHGNNVLTLESHLGIIQSMQIRRHGQRSAHHADALTLFVHHVEHDRHTLTFFAHQVTEALVVGTEVQCTGGVAVDTHLAFDAAALNIVRFSQFALLIESDFGNHENGNALCSFGIAFDSGQNGVNNVRGQIMISGGDETLCADDGVSSVAIVFSSGLQRADVGTRARLSQTHRSGPFACIHFFQKDITQRMLEEILHQSCRAMGKTGIHNESLIAGQKHISQGRRDCSREALAAYFRIVARGHIAGFTIKFP